MKKDVGVFKLENGFWGFRLVANIDGKQVNYRRTTDAHGVRLRTKTQAIKAREALLISLNAPTVRSIPKRTFSQVYDAYAEKGRNDKAYATIRKQDSLWVNHIKPRFGGRFISDVSVAEINDYLAELYYVEDRSFSYVESFLKMFYLIFGQAYSRNFLSVDDYNKLCVNKDTKIRMPKRKINDDDDIVVFSPDELRIMDDYFKGTTLETAYMLGRYCGLRINECFGVKWSDVDFETGTLTIARQMQYQKGVIKLVPVKTRNGRRTIYMPKVLEDFLLRRKAEIEDAEITLSEMRTQQQMFIEETDGEIISSLELVNTLPNGKIRTVNSMKRHTRKLRDEHGITFRYHYLRHTYGTLLAEMGTPPHILCRQMGHASSKVTERYYLTVSKHGVDLLKHNLDRL